MKIEVKKLSELLSLFTKDIEDKISILNDEYNELSIFERWSSILDSKDLAEHCKLVDIKHSTAIISVDHTGWSQQLMLKKKQILTNFQKLYPELEISYISVYVEPKLKKDMEKVIRKRYAIIKKNEDDLNNHSVDKKKLPLEFNKVFDNLRKSIIKHNK